jgi:hypothetical protein
MRFSRNALLFSLMAGNLLVVVIVFSVAAIVSYHSLNAQHMTEIEAYQHQLTSIARQFVEHVWPTSDADMDRLCKQFVGQPQGAPESGSAGGAPVGLPVRLTVVDAEGRVLGDSQYDPAAMKNHKTADRPELLKALEGGFGEDTRRSETLNKPFRYMAEPLACRGQIVGAARISMPVQAISEAQAVMRATVLWASVTSIATFALIGLLINWVWRRLLIKASESSTQTDM